MRRTTPRAWTGRAALATAALALGGYASISSYAVTARISQPDAAYAAMPGDAQVQAALAEQLSGPDATPATRRRADALARTALSRDPLNVSAVATLGLNTQIAGDTAAARRLFAYAARLSRRDYRTQLWFIEDAVDRGSFEDALRHYDIALRTHSTAPALLFPILAHAMTVPEVRASTLAMLMRRPPWGDSFVGYLSGSNTPAAAALVTQTLLIRGYPVPIAATNNMIGSLVRAGELAAAWQIYTALHPGTSRRTSRAGSFEQAESAASAFDWNPNNDGAVSASIDSDGARRMLNFAVSAGGSGTIAQQLQYLPPGSYLLSGGVADIRQPAESRPYWTLTCLNGRGLGQVEIMGAGGQANFAGAFTVPADCAGQWLRLVARPSDALEGVTGSVLTARLRPAA